MEKILKQISEDVSIIKIKVDMITNKIEDHEKRIRSLEKGLWIAIGILAIVELILKVAK